MNPQTKDHIHLSAKKEANRCLFIPSNALTANINSKVWLWQILKNPKNGFVHSAAVARQSRFFNTVANIPWKILTEPAVHVAAALANNKVMHNLCYLLKMYID
jgi:hypothetical protein